MKFQKLESAAFSHLPTTMILTLLVLQKIIMANYGALPHLITMLTKDGETAIKTKIAREVRILHNQTDIM